MDMERCHFTSQIERISLKSSNCTSFKAQKVTKGETNVQAILDWTAFLPNQLVAESPKAPLVRNRHPRRR